MVLRHCFYQFLANLEVGSFKFFNSAIYAEPLSGDANYCNFLAVCFTKVDRSTRGVPGGSSLGFLPHLILINDLDNSKTFCQLHHFADNNT